MRRLPHTSALLALLLTPALLGVIPHTGVCAAQSAGVGASLILPRTPADPVAATGRGAGAMTPGGAARALRVYVEDPSVPRRDRVPVQGRYAVGPGRVSFRPDFPFAAGQAYRVLLSWPGAAGQPLSMRFRLPAALSGAAPRVVGIAPTARVLPANTLRFYAAFSGDARGRFDRRSVRLTDGTGHPVAGAFMSFGTELWSADGRRLTLLFDPARIKRGVAANLTEGPPLAVGGLYTLAIAGPTGPPLSVTFRASRPLRTPLDPAAWRLTPPSAGTRKPLVIRFDRVMDSALLQDEIAVLRSGGQPVPGVARPAGRERAWQFIPMVPWSRAAYRVVFGRSLEDVSGNRIGEALDHEAGQDPQGPTAAALAFRPAGRADF